MNILDYSSQDLVCMRLQSRGRDALFKEMARHLVDNGYIAREEETISLLLRRECLSSTGMRGGFAIPHAYLDSVRKSILMVGLSDQGIDFQTLDDEEVYVVFLLLGPPSQKALHIRLLARLSRVMRREGLREQLLAASSAAEILRLVSAENNDPQPVAG